MSQHDRRHQLSTLGGIVLFLWIAAFHPEGKAWEKHGSDQELAESFPSLQIKDISDLKQYSGDILLIVGKKMGVKLSNEVPEPLILTDLELTEETFSLWLGATKNQFHALSPYYFPEKNIIVVVGSVRLDSLAHELVHYVQVQYQHLNIAFPDAYQLELEAVAIQRWFKQNYMR